MDPQVSQMTIGCGISHNNTIHIMQVQFLLLYTECPKKMYTQG
jgi:hypothetical protein